MGELLPESFGPLAAGLVTGKSDIAELAVVEIEQAVARMVTAGLTQETGEEARQWA
ncbi:hypothetical protein [Modicisalibacter sp. R2A 31.J]|uniref:hypothetical protein n=1 Tax=Modicisalibacter sp. R2A 31.J TaxID=2831898 RepID=UPI001EF0FB52|nr:hypothetical protein [Modicisalibacter sp. R2A 31.J]